MSELQSLGSVPICVAVDRSGSTYGTTLETEIAVVQDICRLRSPASKHPIRLLPWCDKTLAPISLPEGTAEMQSLQGSGGTNPSVLYSSTACLQALQESGIWFLLTDGQIYDNLVEDFALKTAKAGLHNKACVIIVFDHSTSGPPSSCNISVGIAAYAVAPDCLFLFHDIPTGIVKIMQAKGRFKELLPMENQEHVQPLLNKYTTWADLPRVSYEDLSRIKLSSVRALGEQELALPSGLVVTMPDLLSGKADQKIVEQIVKDDDNLKSVVLASMTRGTGKDLEAWLLSQQKPMPKIQRGRPDIAGRAQQAITQLLEALGNSAEEVELLRLRGLLRSAHDDNWREFKKIRGTENFHYKETRDLNQRARNGLFIMDKKGGHRRMWENHMQGHRMSHQDSEDGRLRALHDDSNKTDPVFLPGFQRQDPADQFTGSCMLCQRTSVLTILLKRPPNITTSNFPLPGTYSKLAFPIAMSNFAETDIMSFFICCDSCAFYLLRNGASPYTETITGALCLVSVAANQRPWLEALETALKGRFNIPDLMTVCISILDRMLVKNDARNAALGDKTLFRDCAYWAIRNLINIAEVPTTLSPSFGSSQDRSALIRLSEVLSRRSLADPGRTENIDIFLLRYPVPGFVVLLRLLRDQGVAKEQIQTVLFQRLLFHVMEVYFENFGRGASAAPAAAESPIGKILSPQQTAGPPDRRAVVACVPFAELVKYNLLDAANTASFRTVAEFGDMEKRTGPAMAVFLHHLSRYGGVYASPIACFNGLKASTSMRKVILTPLAISDGLSADLISQL
ncbi:MAG: hypothetical protein M1840_006469 [Geoglossum simile]|nr:MAG: hypothetical protein M1840_006469 [Geoglossum simile]